MSEIGLKMEYNLDFLENIYSILNKYKEKENKSGNNISILKISGKDHDEVVVCRLIAFLLNPKENHNQDVKFLNLFLEEIGEETIQQNENFDVITEFPTDQGRRIDIVLKSNKRFIPIEVKIYASDQKEQCVHYYNYSHSNYNAEKVFYLTPYEHMPDESSKGDLKLGETLKLITFKEQILNWLENCEKDNSNYTPMLLELIRELKIAIRKFCGLVENKEMNEELLKEILKNENNLEAAKAIYSVGQEIKPILLWENFCKKIELKLGDWHKFNYEEEYDSNNALTVSVCDAKIFIHFYELFSYIVIDVDNNQELSEKIENELKETYTNFIYEKPTDTGFAINNTKDFFIGHATESPFELCNQIKNEKEVIINKMREFIEFVSKISMQLL